MRRGIVFARSGRLPLALVVMAGVLAGGCSFTPGDTQARLGRVDDGSPTSRTRAHAGKVEEFRETIGDTLYFTADSRQLSKEARDTLLLQAEWLERYSAYLIVVEGHADEQGSGEHNAELSFQRADNVRSFLAAKGVNPRRIRIEALGNKNRRASCTDTSCLSENRRVHVVLVSSGRA